MVATTFNQNDNRLIYPINKHGSQTNDCTQILAYRVGRCTGFVFHFLLITSVSRWAYLAGMLQKVQLWAPTEPKTPCYTAVNDELDRRAFKRTQWTPIQQNYNTRMAIAPNVDRKHCHHTSHINEKIVCKIQ